MGGVETTGEGSTERSSKKMISQQVAHYFKARRIGEGKWKAKCPLHQGHSDGSLSIAATDDGKTLVKCWGGCRTVDVLSTAGLSFTDLFPPSSRSSSQRQRIDPRTRLQRKAEIRLGKWKEKTGHAVRDRVWRRHRLITLGECQFPSGKNTAWELLALGYHGLSRLEWLADLLDSKHRESWVMARQFLGVEL